DAIASAAIGLMILPRTWALLREAVDVLLEATPKGVDLTEVRQHLSDTNGVIGVHDLHAWTITSGLPVLSAHVVVAQEALADGCGGSVLDQLGQCLAGHFDVQHCTFQLEAPGHLDHEIAHHA
ncbi:MAG: cation diffusion facilitator family transporter, partial [Dermatophilaceae bacterium]